MRLGSRKTNAFGQSCSMNALTPRSSDSFALRSHSKNLRPAYRERRRPVTESELAQRNAGGRTLALLLTLRSSDSVARHVTVSERTGQGRGTLRHLRTPASRASSLSERICRS